MKRIFTAVLIIACLSVTALASDVVSWVRIATTDTQIYKELAVMPGVDIASYHPGRYVDIIATESTLGSLSESGYLFDYLTYDIHNPVHTKGKGYSDYTNYDELVTRINTLATNYPDIVEVTVYENSTRQDTHDIYLIKISDDVATDDPDEPDLLTVGVHHAREPMSLEVNINFAEQICAEYATVGDVMKIVDKLELYIVPLMNPEGYNYDDVTVADPKKYWRKNSYDWPNPNAPDDLGNARGTGVDPNRNYSYMWAYDDYGSSPDPMSVIFRGVGALSEPENQMIADLAVAKDFISALTYHQYGEILIRPYGYDNVDPPPADLDIFEDIADGYADVVDDEIDRDYDLVTGSYNGNFIDYLYGEHGAFAFCVELNSFGDGGFYPDDSLIPSLTDAHYKALKWWCGYIEQNYTAIEGLDPDPAKSQAFTLGNATPNPANEKVTISFALPETSNVKFDVYDISGRKVMPDISDRFNAGGNEIELDVSTLSNGIYLYRMEVDGFAATKKLIVRK